MSDTCVSLAPPTLRYKSCPRPLCCAACVLLRQWSGASSFKCSSNIHMLPQLMFDQAWVILFFLCLFVFSICFNCLPLFHVTVKYSWTFSRTKLTLNSSFWPTPTEQLMRARIDEPLFLIRPPCSIWMRSWGIYYNCPRARPPRRWLRFYI